MKSPNSARANDPVQSVQPNKRALPPKTALVGAKKRRFLEALKDNGGHVSRALASAKLPRQTAYDHFKNDREFRYEWQEALENAHDRLYGEARRRAVEGDVSVRRRKDGSSFEVRKKSDPLLIYLLKHGEYRKKWRGRVLETGRIAVRTMQEEGKRCGLSVEQINRIREAMLKGLEDVSLL